MSFKGRFKPKNPEKYKGDANKIIYRSSWEQRFMRYCDDNPNITRWASEEFSIPYRSPLDGKLHRYFPDFWVEVVKKDSGNVEYMVIEVKPKNQCTPPERGKKQMRTYIKEVARWGVNDSKWKAAEDFCIDRGWKFVIFTEDDLAMYNTP